MDFTDVMYNKDDVFKAFEETFNAKIKNRANVNNIIFCGIRLFEGKNDRISEVVKAALDVIKSGSEFSSVMRTILVIISDGTEEYWNKEKEENKSFDIISLQEIHRPKYNILEDTYRALIYYCDVTCEYINQKRFNVTIPHLSAILDTSDDYINRFISPLLDTFKLDTIARYAVKTLNNQFELDFINKNKFISRNSLKKFLSEHFKYSTTKVQVDLTMPKEFEEKLRVKFRTDNMYNAAFRKLTEELDMSSQYLKQLKEASKQKAITKNDLPLNKIENNNVLEFIIAGEFNLQAPNNIRRKMEAIAREELENRIKETNHGYAYKSFNPTQLYFYLDNKITTTRFVLDNVYTSNKDKMQEKIKVRYSTGISLLDAAQGKIANDESINCNILQENNMLYSIDAIKYIELTKGMNGDEEKRLAVVNYYYKELMSDNFTVYAKKKEYN